MSALPAGFEALEPFADVWAVSGSADRAHMRSVASAADRAAFFDAARDLLAPALDHLDQKPLATFDDRETRLMNLMLSLAHVALAVEVQGDDEPKHALMRQHMRITRTPADAA